MVGCHGYRDEGEFAMAPQVSGRGHKGSALRSLGLYPRGARRRLSYCVAVCLCLACFFALHSRAFVGGAFAVVAAAWVLGCLYAQRLRDAGRSPLWALLPLLAPVAVGLLVGLGILLLLPRDEARAWPALQRVDQLPNLAAFLTWAGLSTWIGLLPSRTTPPELETINGQ